jgi:hypothetical protein
MSIRTLNLTPSLALLAGVLFASSGCLSPAEEPAARPVGKAEMDQIQTTEAIGPQAPGERVNISIDAVNKPAKLGKKWNQPGHQKLGPKGMEIALGGVKHNKVVELHFGNAHSYWIRFFNGDEQVGQIRAWPKPGPDREKMIFRELYPADEIVKKGYDKIRIVPVSDRRYSIGAVLLRDDKKHARKGGKGNKGKGGPGLKRPAAGGAPGAPAGAKPVGAKPGQPAAPKPAAPTGAKPAQP